MAFKRTIHAIDTHAGTPMRVVTGTSWIHGINTIVLDHDDPFPEEFTVGDIWA